MAKQLSFSNESREALEKGVNFVANAVKVTIGPKAKNVVIERKFGSPDVVRDGSTVAKEIEIDNPISNLGAKLIEQVASKTKESAGDGTTTATILTQKMVQEGLKILKSYLLIHSHQQNGLKIQTKFYFLLKLIIEMEE